MLNTLLRACNLSYSMHAENIPRHLTHDGSFLIWPSPSHDPNTFAAPYPIYPLNHNVGVRSKGPPSDLYEYDDFSNLLLITVDYEYK